VGHKFPDWARSQWATLFLFRNLSPEASSIRPASFSASPSRCRCDPVLASSSQRSPSS